MTSIITLLNSLFLRSYLHRVEIAWRRDSMYHMTARHIAHISTWELTHRRDWGLLQYGVPQRLIVNCTKRGKMNFSDDQDTAIGKDHC